MSSRPLRVIALGLGPIGQAVCREIAAAPDLKLVGAVDPAPALAGQDLGKLLKDPRLAGLRVSASLDELKRTKADVAAHLSASRFPQAAAQIEDVVKRGLPVASTCEEMIAAPWRWPRPAAALDRAAKKAGVAVIATGINPGFVMDLLPAGLSNVCVSVKGVRVERWVDTSTRRRALQDKTGAGITPAEFRRRVKENAIGHVGLRDSAVFLMTHLPLAAEIGEEKIRPILATKELRRGKERIPRGAVAGVHQTVTACDPTGRRTVAVFDLKMAYGLENPHDSIRIDGDPPIRLHIEGGIHGDRATVGAVLANLRFAVEAPPGLGT